MTLNGIIYSSLGTIFMLQIILLFDINNLERDRFVSPGSRSLINSTMLSHALHYSHVDVCP